MFGRTLNHTKTEFAIKMTKISETLTLAYRDIDSLIADMLTLGKGGWSFYDHNLTDDGEHIVEFTKEELK